MISVIDVCEPKLIAGKGNFSSIGGFPNHLDTTEGFMIVIKCCHWKDPFISFYAVSGQVERGGGGL